MCISLAFKKLFSSLNYQLEWLILRNINSRIDLNITLLLCLSIILSHSDYGDTIHFKENSHNPPNLMFKGWVKSGCPNSGYRYF